MKIVILGCGRVGARLAQLMEEDGHTVTIIDAEPASFDRLPRNFKGQTVLGTGIDVDVLKSAGIEDADAFAAVTNFDNTNIMACEVAKEIFGVEKVLARIYDPGREDLYHQLGLDTVCPTTLVATASRAILQGGADDIDPEELLEAGSRMRSRAAVPAVPSRTAEVTTRVVPSETVPLAMPVTAPTAGETGTDGKLSPPNKGLFGRFRH